MQQNDGIGNMPPNHDTAQQTAQDRRCQHSQRLMRLETSFQTFAEETRKRISTVETGISKIMSCLEHVVNAGVLVPRPPQQNTQPQPLPHAAPGVVGSASPEAAPPAPAQQTPDCSLRFGPITTKWFTKNPYTDFEVTVRDEAGNRIINTHGWQIQVRLISGHGLYVDHFLYAPSLVFPVVEGRAVVSGLKFSAVTSRNGGHFRLEVSLLSPPNLGILPARSDEIVILSERLKNDSKAESVLELGPTDSISRIPGIGKKYQAHFAELGLATVADLAAVELETHPTLGREHLVEIVRNERGALNETKLAQLLRDSAKVLRRSAVVTETVEAAAEPAQMQASSHIRNSPLAPFRHEPTQKRLKLQSGTWYSASPQLARGSSTLKTTAPTNDSDFSD